MANSTIKGLTVEIGGDTTKLGQALQKVEGQSKSLSSELSQINKLLKMDPGNTELLAQKQKVLTEAVQACAEKLKTLREAEAQVQEQFARGAVSQEQVRALQREIISTEQRMQGYQDAMKEGTDKTKVFGEAAEEAEPKTSKFGDTLKKVATVGLKAIATAAAAAATAAVALGKSVVESYSEYEQLVGGVDTLFEQSSEKVQQYAANAYKTAGLSANDYMETVTSFSASLIQSLDGDTEKAAELADQAITDMADNANKMGTSMESLQNAYAGFAKSNYTMLDNLKLGYGGTKEEMERLLEDAEKISGIKYDISSYADVVQAIHVMQESMSIAGTTAQEAEKTISGSVNATKAAWSNLLTGLGDSGADITDLCNKMVDSLKNVITNITPVVQSVVAAFPTMATALLDSVTQLLPTVLDVVTQLINSILTAISNLLPTLLPTVIEAGQTIISTVVQLIPQMVTALLGTVPQLVTCVLDIATSLLNAISGALPSILTTVVDIIPQIIDALLGAVPQLLQAAITFLTAIVDAIPKVVASLSTALPKIVTTICDALTESVGTLLSAAVTLFEAIVDAIPKIIPPLVKAIPTIVTKIIDTLVGLIPKLLDGALTLFTAIIDAIPLLIKELIPAIPQIISAITTTLINNVPTILSAAVQLFWGIIQAIPQIIAELVKQVPSIISAIAQTLIANAGSVLSAALDIGKNIVSGLWQGIKDTTTWLYDKISGWLEGLWDGICDFFGIHSPSRKMAWVGEMLDKGLANGIEENAKDPFMAAEQIAEDTLKAAQGGVDGMEITRNLQVSAAQSAAASSAYTTGSLEKKLDAILTALDRGQVITLDSQALVGGTSALYDSVLGQRRVLAARGAI